MRSAALLLSLVLTSGALAQDATRLLLGSKHFYEPDDGIPFNEINPGPIFDWHEQLGPLDLSAGAFINSHRNFTPYGAFGYTYPINEDFDLRASLGLAYYGDDARESSSIDGWQLVPTAEVHMNQFWIGLVPVPQEDDDTSALLFYGIKFKM